MKRAAVLLAMPFLCALGAGAVPAAPPASLRAVAALSNDEASQHQPVSFDATVIYFRAYDQNLFVQDGGAAIYVQAATSLHLVPGDRVLVRGTMHESFRPYVDSRDIALIGHVPLPKPVQPTYQQMIRAEADCQFVTVRALVRSADLTPNSRSRTSAIVLHMLVEGEPVDANIDSNDENNVKDMLDAEVQITGAISGRFDNKMQLTGLLLHVQSMDNVKILKRASSDPWSIPVTSMDQVITNFRTVDLTQRTRVQGTVTYYQPGGAVVLQDGPRSLWIETDSWIPLHIGDQADAIGFPQVENGFLTMTRAEIRGSAVQAPVAPSLLTWRDLAVGGNQGRSRVFDLVSVEGLVVTEVRQATQDEYVIESGGHLFSAILHHPSPASRILLAPMKQIPAGSRIRVTGICMLSDANPFNGEVPFNILMRDLDDIQMIAQPPWLNVRHLLLIVGLLFSVLIALGVRSWAVERRVRQRTSAMAYLEQRRSRILEDINKSRALSEILESITEVISFRLHGAACWCEIAEGARLGKKPPKITSQRVIRHEIPGRSGAALGTIFAAINRRRKPTAEETAALSFGAGLATLAIETSRLYSDLVHRSEFDLLTDVANRFSLEKHLHELIDRSRRTAGIFGFVFIDLDQFKQVNDLYGHQVGDLYLQQAAQRMKHQLRPGDTLARLGGDEFAAVVSSVRNRSEVEEIAQRLEHCFDEAISIDGHAMQGSASVGIALYPEDADSADTLLSKADTAMYEVKQFRKGSRQKSAGSGLEFASKQRA
ncbi:MAG: diguanylate cyclase domain-containing protein [Terracidiphilus sp.]